MREMRARETRRAARATAKEIEPRLIPFGRQRRRKRISWRFRGAVLFPRR